ncbi:DUF440 family protein, partial [Escherichia coli]|nr:DUF440 family protein [Escherichia coli]
FEERGGAELFDPAEDWQEHVDVAPNSVGRIRRPRRIRIRVPQDYVTQSGPLREMNGSLGILVIIPVTIMTSGTPNFHVHM